MDTKELKPAVWRRNDPIMGVWVYIKDPRHAAANDAEPLYDATALRLLTEEVEKLREHTRKQAEDIMTLGQLVYADADTTWKDRAASLRQKLEEEQQDRWATRAQLEDARQKLDASKRALKGLLSNPGGRCTAEQWRVGLDTLNILEFPDA